MKYRTVEEVPVWKLAHQLTLSVYKLTEEFPKTEQFGLVSQLRRASSSIPANITEGFYRRTTKELVQFLYTARGSLGEVIYFLLLAKDLGYMSDNQYFLLRKDAELVGSQLYGWIKSLINK